MRYLTPLVLVIALAGLVAATAFAGGTKHGAKGPLTFQVRLIQEATYRHSHPPAGDPGDSYLETTTKLPGGTITANGKNVSLTHGLVVPIQSGTGIFKGVKGTVDIAPNGSAVDVFKLVMASRSPSLKTS
jgi:hypothetical protein